MVFYFFIFHLDIFIPFSYKFYKPTDVTRNLRLIKKNFKGATFQAAPCFVDILKIYIKTKVQIYKFTIRM